MTPRPATAPSPVVTRSDLTRPATRAPREEVRRLASELEAVFVNQLFQAMRASVPQGGPLPHDPGQEMFTSLMDQRLASEVALQLRRGIGESLYRQLARRLPDETPASPATLKDITR